MALRRATLLVCLIVAGLTGPYDCVAQALRSRRRQRRGVDTKTHLFHPLISPDVLALDASGQVLHSSGPMSISAAQQINLLLADKASRSPAQRKLSSKLIYTVRMLQGLPAAPGVASLETGVETDDDGNLLVDITADVSESFLRQLRNEGAYIYNSFPEYRSVRALVPSPRLEAIAGLPSVAFIRPKQQAMTAVFSGVGGTPAPTGQGSATSEGDLTHRAYDARMAFGVNGAGIKIGVLSDGATSLTASQATGDLPSDVTVLPGQIGDGDEGTAMMEIVHDLAPGAKLYFASAFGGIASFAQNIRDLRAAGCDVIIDDVFYFDESPFVDGQTGSVPSPSNAGLVLQAVNDVAADGALYFSAAGNEGSFDNGSAGSYEGDFVDGGSLGLLAGGTVHQFGANQYDTITAGGGNYVMLFWSDPLGASNNDYDLFVLNSDGSAVLEASTDIQDGSQDPEEWLTPTYNLPGNRLVVFKHAGAQDRYFQLNTFRGRLAVGSVGETHGHSHAALAYSVAATPAKNPWSPASANGPYPNPFNSSNETELFSSDGPRRLFYQEDGTPFTPGNVSSTGGIVRQKPDITAADGVSVTGVGGFGSPFYGTSAAAPHAGAIAALLKSALATVTSAQIKTALTGTAVDIMGVGEDRDSGAGVVMAFDAVKSLGVAGSANPELGSIAASDHPGNGDGMLEAGEGGIVTIQLRNTSGVANATAISGVLTTATPGVSVTVPNVSAYANLPKLTGVANNTSPFTFTLANEYPCGQPIDFVLTVTYSGGPSPRALRFTIPTGPLINIDKSLDGTAPASPMLSLTTATGVQTGRVFRNGVATACGSTPKLWPGFGAASGSRQYDSYSFTAAQNSCTTFALTSTNGISLFLDAYSPTFNGSDISTNYSGDPGLSSTMQSFSMAIVAGDTYALTVHDINAGAPSGTNYNLQFSGCAFAPAAANRVPVAQVHDVIVVAAANHTASASIDNGSYDPDRGDTITISQTPPGPYPVGLTTVLLTVADSQGATAQASAGVTVKNPDFEIDAQVLPPKTVNAGEAITQTVVVHPNPGPWNSAIMLSCSGLPELASCTFNPTSVTPGAADASSTLTLNTTALPNQASASTLEKWLGFGMLALLMLGTISPHRSRATRMVLGMLLFSVITMLFTHCSGMSIPTRTPAGNYTITVSARSVGVTHDASFQLTVH